MPELHRLLALVDLLFYTHRSSSPTLSTLRRWVTRSEPHMAFRDFGPRMAIRRGRATLPVAGAGAES